MQQEPREAQPRAIERALALAPSSRGRSTAPHFFIWLPILVKVAAAAGVAVILAVIGVKAGAHRPPPGSDPAASAMPAVVAAALVPGTPATPTTADSMATVVDAGTATPAPGPTEPAEGGGLLPDGRIVLNAATEAELTKLPGIGPSRAQAILALRQRLKRFRAVEDLLRVKGIGRKMLRRLRPNIVLDRPTLDALPAPASTAVASPRTEDSDKTTH
jgi:competence protein ComEA